MNKKNNVNHRTTKVSEKIDNKGIKKRIDICYSRINYYKIAIFIYSYRNILKIVRILLQKYQRT